MADELDKNILVHQAIHGYADGHRLLASSINLKPRDQKTMLVMSDASGAGANLESDGYLTGYPLPDSRFYAIARTWPATEMTRPGCVWTHTLLVDFADLATLSSMNFLDSAFKRPPPDFQPDEYANSLRLEKRDGEEALKNVSPDSVKRILAPLYGFPKDKILSAAIEESSQLVFAVWAQQWPRLRRTFRFCTSSFADRSSEGASFDLQFTSVQDRSYRSRFVDALDAERATLPPVPWIEDAVQDIFSGKEGELRKFLREVGGDVAGGREVFVPLCSLHTMIPHFEQKADFIDDAISLIDNSFNATSAGSLRTLLVSAVARHPENINDRSADFLCKNLDLLSQSALRDETHGLGSSIWGHRPVQLVGLLDNDGPLSEFAKSTIKNLDSTRLIEVVTHHVALLPNLLSLRPDLLTKVETWSIHGDWSRNVLAATVSDAIGETIILAGRSDLAQEMLERFGVSRLLRLLSNAILAGDGKSHNYSVWFQVIVRDPGAVAEFLNREPKIEGFVLLEIARRSYPDFIPNDVGTDPWATATRNISGRLDEPERQYLAGYLLARAFGYRSRSQADLIEFSFEEIYFGAFNQRLADEAWQLLEKSLPRSWFYNWDHCQRLRDAITDMFVNRDLPPAGFTRITCDNSLFIELSRLASQNSRGRKYLKKVLRFLEDNGGSASKIKIIENVI